MLRSARNRREDEMSLYTSVSFFGENAISKTVQSEKDNCDINVILKRFRLGGQLPTSARVPSYENYEGIFDFQSAMNAVRSGEEAFAELPSDIRRKFANSPQAFLEYAANPENIDGLRKMGLAKKLESVSIVPETDVPSNKEPKGARDSGKRANKAAKTVDLPDGDGPGE